MKWQKQRMTDRRRRRRMTTGGGGGGKQVKREELNAMITGSLFFRRKNVIAFMNSLFRDLYFIKTIHHVMYIDYHIPSS